MSMTFTCGDKATELNLANVNACEIMRVLDPGVAPEPCGEWDEVKLRAIHKRLMVLLNTDRKGALVAEPFVERRAGRPTVYHGGRSDEYVARRLRDFLRLVTAALERKAPVRYD